VAPDSMNPRMSFFVTRPPVPVPGTTDGSIPCSAAIRATTGDTKVLPFPPGAAGAAATGATTGSDATAVTGGSGAAAAATGSGTIGGAGGAASSGVGAGASGAEAGGATSVPAGAIRAMTVPTSTVSPSWTRICATTPSAGLGTSVSTLSVEISSSGSSRPIASPTCLSHFVTVPSDTDTPIWGITTSVCIPVDTVPPSRRRALSVRSRRLRPAGCMPSRAAAQTAPACRAR